MTTLRSPSPLRRRWSRLLGGLVTAAILLPVPAFAALSITWSSVTSGMSSLVSATVSPTNSDLVVFGLNPSGTTTPETFTITGSGTAGGVTSGTFNATYSLWNAIHITGGSVTFEATYSNQVLWNPAPQFTSAQQPGTSFSGIGQGVNSNPQPVTFTITFTNATWTVTPKSSSPTLTFSVQ